jgi:hypothetical protein
MGLFETQNCLGQSETLWLFFSENKFEVRSPLNPVKNSPNLPRFSHFSMGELLAGVLTENCPQIFLFIFFNLVHLYESF